MLFVLVVRASAREAICGSGLVDYCKVAAPVYAFFLLIDRLYQFYRFGSFTNTYVSLFAKEQRLQDPTLPREFSLEHAVSRRLSGPAVQAGEVDLSL